MLSPSDIRNEIEKRICNYLSRDKSGIRKALLKLIIKAKTVTVPMLHEILSKTFDVSYHSVASMVGIISSKLGILAVKKANDDAIGVYELKTQYADIVEKAIASV
ncbi:MAG: DUF2551 domain-containing protein [Methanocorpusculum sp.]|nr:DUF2551 domain-containing protein [Methanocorpusculum sp.]